MESMPESIAERYDAILYPGMTRSSAHPERLATIGRLFGLTCAPLDDCRVLELGCGSGENLMSIALGLPGSSCVGIDIAARPIEIGREMVDIIGLTNIRLEQIDVMEMPEDFGEFDYIIAHGLFSWIPPEVRTRVLEIVRRHLSPIGIAFISYNTYPGWHTMMAARDVMRYHAQHFTDPIKQIQQARGILDFVAKATLETATAYREGILSAQKKVRGLGDGSLFHDDLSSLNFPFYFHQFAEMIAAHDLQFLGEADFIEMQEHLFPPEVVATLRKLAGEDIVVKEQFLDFLKGRMFRQSLVVHNNREIDRVVVPSRLMGMTATSNCKPLPSDPEHPQTSRFELPSGVSFSTDHPAAAAVLLALHRHSPSPVPFDQLHQEVWLESGKGSTAETLEATREQLADILLWTSSHNLVELRSFMPQMSPVATERPLASPLARLQGEMSTGVTNLLHQRVVVSGGIGSALLGLLDGTRTRRDLLAELQAMPEEELQSKSAEELEKEIDETLDMLARHALLVE